MHTSAWLSCFCLLFAFSLILFCFALRIYRSARLCDSVHDYLPPNCDGMRDIRKSLDLQERFVQWTVPLGVACLLSSFVCLFLFFQPSK